MPSQKLRWYCGQRFMLFARAWLRPLGQHHHSPYHHTHTRLLHCYLDLPGTSSAILLYRPIYLSLFLCQFLTLKGYVVTLYLILIKTIKKATASSSSQTVTYTAGVWDCTQTNGGNACLAELGPSSTGSGGGSSSDAARVDSWVELLY